MDHQFGVSYLLNVSLNQGHLDISRRKLIPPTNLLKLSRNSHHWLQYSAGLSASNREKPHARPFFNNPQNGINGQAKLICSLE
jgi:hypothetical protein